VETGGRKSDVNQSVTDIEGKVARGDFHRKGEGLAGKKGNLICKGSSRGNCSGKGIIIILVQKTDCSEGESGKEPNPEGVNGPVLQESKGEPGFDSTGKKVGGAPRPGEKG